MLEAQGAPEVFFYKEIQDCSFRMIQVRRKGGHHWNAVEIDGIIGEFYYYCIVLKRKNNEDCLKAVI